MPTRRQFLKFAGGSSLAAVSWMANDDGDIREVYDAIPGRQGPRERRERPPTQPMPDFDASPHSDYTEEHRKAVEQVNFEHLNQYRKRRNRGQLEWSDNLAWIARRHTHEQSVEGWVGHKDPVDEGWEFRSEEKGRAVEFDGRMEVMGYRVSKMHAVENTQWEPIYYDEVSSENVLKTQEDDEASPMHLGTRAFRNFVSSPSHNRAMLDRRFDTVGIGVTLADTRFREESYGNNYLDLRVTQVFTGPKEDYEWVVRS
jgi:uncharacterized protein YkwD